MRTPTELSAFRLRRVLLGLACALLTPACFAPEGKDPTATTTDSSSSAAANTTTPELTTTVTPTTTRDPSTGPDPTPTATSDPGIATSSTHSDPTLTTADTSTAPIDTDTSSSGSTDPMTGSTTVDPAICGDHMVNSADEQCDDGDTVDGDGCSANCKFEYRYTFVTMMAWFGDIGGVDTADQHCANEAAGTDKLNGRIFRAWLSDSNVDAKNHVMGVSLPVRRTDEVIVANGNADLVTGMLLAPIDRNANGVLVAPSAPCGSAKTRVWTGTGVDGMKAGDVCTDWQVGGNNGLYGNMSSMDGSWTDCQLGPCAMTEAHLYCIQVDP